MTGRHFLMLGIGATLAASALLESPLQGLPRAPAYQLRRVVPQRPAHDGAFAPDGHRFVYVHNDTLWLADAGPGAAPPRRVGAPAVASVYSARWLAGGRLLVHQVLPRQGGALGELDLGRGRFRVVARQVAEGDFGTSRHGGLLVWRSGTAGDVWLGVLSGGEPEMRRVGPAAGALPLIPAPAGAHLAGVSAEGKPFLRYLEGDRTEFLDSEAGERAVAAAWSPNGTAVAYLMRQAARADAGGDGCHVAVYRVGRGAPAAARPLPQACDALAWDARGDGLLCREDAGAGGLWYVPVARLGAVRRLHPGPVRDFAALAGGCALAAVPVGEERERGYLYLLGLDGALSQRITNLPSFDAISDVSPDGRKVLVTRGARDDRGDLHREATLWLLELPEPR